MPALSLARLAPKSMLRLSPRTIRLRLTLFYSGLFLASGAVLLAITYVLFSRATGVSVIIRNGKPAHAPPVIVKRGLSNAQLTARFPHQLAHEAQLARAQAAHDHATELHQLLVQSGIALAIMTVASIALGWLVAGRVLRPLRSMTRTTRQISERNLHERLALHGPRDELKDLADTVDGLLARLETAFDAQRRFVANAAHELRTPLTVLRALLDETLTDPSATIDSFRATSTQLLALGQEQELLLEALLTLASSERGLDRREPFDLSIIADTLLLDPRPEIDRLRVQIDADIQPAATTGDATLAERLVSNLIDNAVRHNIPDGKVQVRTGTRDGRAFLIVTNTGPEIPGTEMERLFEPFQRLAPDRTARNDGHHGLGLSIVRAITTAHHATLTAKAQPQGGLTIQVGFPIVGNHGNATAAPNDHPHTPVVIKRRSHTDDSRETIRAP